MRKNVFPNSPKDPLAVAHSLNHHHNSHQSWRLIPSSLFASSLVLPSGKLESHILTPISPFAPCGWSWVLVLWLSRLTVRARHGNDVLMFHFGESAAGCQARASVSLLCSLHLLLTVSLLAPDVSLRCPSLRFISSTFKELNAYRKEVTKQTEKIAALEAAGADEHDVKKQVSPNTQLVLQTFVFALALA